MSPRPFPTHVQIQCSTACGAACSICPHPIESPRWPRGAMSDELFAGIVDQLRGRDVEYLTPYLMADSMSDRAIFDRIATLREALPATWIELSTTGLYLAGRLADRLIAAPLSELRISSHGITRAEWARTMPGLDYDRAWSNLEAFIERWRAERPYRLRIVTLTGLWPAHREAEIKDFWAQRDVEVIQWEVITRADQVDLTVFGGDGPAPGVDTRLVAPPYRCDFDRDTRWLHILNDGRVTLCCMDYKREAIIGDLNTMSIEQLWQGEAFSDMRARLRGDVEPPIAICERCEWHVSCECAAESTPATAVG
jgi:hypothetical protein